MDRRRRLLWKRLCKAKARIKCAKSISQLMKLLQDKSDLEQELSEDYEAVNRMAENEAVLRIKDNPKAFFSFAKSRQKTRARIGPFLDISTGKPNPSPDFAANELSNQYSSVFVNPREEWKVPDVKTFFTDNSDGFLSNIDFTEEDIMKACGELKANSAAGADGVHALLGPSSYFSIWLSNYKLFAIFKGLKETSLNNSHNVLLASFPHLDKMS